MPVQLGTYIRNNGGGGKHVELAGMKDQPWRCLGPYYPPVYMKMWEGLEAKRNQLGDCSQTFGEELKVDFSFSFYDVYSAALISCRL